MKRKKALRPNLSAIFGAASCKAEKFDGAPPMMPDEISCDAEAAVPEELEKRLHNLGESFQQMLLRLIDESGMTDAACYKRAGISKQLFSRIRSNPDYRPTKPTVLAFAAALELSLDDTKALLERAGCALSDSSRFDVIVSFFFGEGVYDLFEINAALFRYGQPLIGSA